MPVDSGFEEFTPRELEVLELLIEGCTNKEIAKRLQIALCTVEFHLRNIYQKREYPNVRQQ